MGWEQAGSWVGERAQLARSGRVVGAGLRHGASACDDIKTTNRHVVKQKIVAFFYHVANRRFVAIEGQMLLPHAMLTH